MFVFHQISPHNQKHAAMKFIETRRMSVVKVLAYILSIVIFFSSTIGNSTIIHAGNVGDYFTITYNVRNEQPPRPVLTAEPGDWSVRLSWEPTNTPDLLGYHLFREEANAPRLIASFRPGQQLTFTDRTRRPDTYHTYFVEVLDRFGNTVESERVSIRPNDTNPYPPVAMAGFNFNIPIGVEAAFDGSASTDLEEIVSYHWDFGDGSTAYTAQAIHIFETAGEYEVTLTVTNRAGNEDSSSITVSAMSPQGTGALRVRVLDRETGLALPGATVFADLPGGPVILHADRHGEVLLTGEPGEHRVAAYIQDYLPAEDSFLLLPGVTETATIRLERGELIVGRIEHRRLTLSEIEAAGIDVRAPENQFVYTFNVELVFQGRPIPEFSFTTNGMGQVLRPPTLRIPIGDGSGSSGGQIQVRPIPIPRPNRPDVPPTIAFLTMSGSVSFLKEFFEVSVIMQNQADSQFSLVDNTVRLNLPDGLSLAPTFIRQDSTQRIDEIAGGETASVSWIVRGDRPGSYDLTADFQGTLMPFQEIVTATFKTEEPLVVNGGNGLFLTLQPNGLVQAGQDFPIRFWLSNESDINFYMATVRFDNDNNSVQHTGQAFEFERVTDAIGMPVLRDGDSVTVRELHPGEILRGTYVTTFNHDLTEDELLFRLTRMFMNINGIPVVVVPGEPEEEEYEYIIPPDTEWLYWTYEDFETYLYITSEPVEEFGPHRDVYLGVSRASGQSFGDLYVRLSEDDWQFIGHVIFTSEPVGEFAGFGAGIMPMEIGFAPFSVEWEQEQFEIWYAAMTRHSNPTDDLIADEFAYRFSFGHRARFPSQEVLERQAIAWRININDSSALYTFYLALQGEERGLYLGVGPFNYMRYMPPRGLSIIEYVLENQHDNPRLQDRGNAAYTARDERRWRVNVGQEFQYYVDSQLAVGATPISYAEFVRITSLYWEADALRREQRRLEGIAQTVVAGAAAIMAFYSITIVAAEVKSYLGMRIPEYWAKLKQGPLAKFRNPTNTNAFVLPPSASPNSKFVGNVNINLRQMTPNQVRAKSADIVATVNNSALKIPSANTKVVMVPETKASYPMKSSEVVGAWNRFLGPNTSNIHPRTGQSDPDRIFSEFGTRAIRFGNHEMGGIGTPKGHFHFETWTFDPINDVFYVTNMLQRIIP